MNNLRVKFSFQNFEIHLDYFLKWTGFVFGTLQEYQWILTNATVSKILILGL